jgi:2-methylfumaryl-CoA isomerase
VADGVAALEAKLETSFATSDHNRFVHRHHLFELFQRAADGLGYAELEARLTAAGATFERYRTMHEAAQDPALVGDNPLFGPSPANPSGFEYPAPRSFANIPQRAAGAPQAAPYLGAHSELVLAERLGLSSGAIANCLAHSHCRRQVRRRAVLADRGRAGRSDPQSLDGADPDRSIAGR